MKVSLFNIAYHLSADDNSLSLGAGYLKSYFEKYSKYKDKVKIDLES